MNVKGDVGCISIIKSMQADFEKRAQEIYSNGYRKGFEAGRQDAIEMLVKNLKYISDVERGVTYEQDS